jgi:hypothetical protein
MLSTSQALTEWQTVLKALAYLKPAAAQADRYNLPEQHRDPLNNSLYALAEGLLSPVATWKQLLKKKVSTHLQRSSPTSRQVHLAMRLDDNISSSMSP